MQILAQPTTQAFLSSLGLFLDIVGVILVFKFGVPLGDYLRGVLTWRRHDTNREKRSQTISACGLACIIIGFMLQIVSNWLPWISFKLSCAILLHN